MPPLQRDVMWRRGCPDRYEPTEQEVCEYAQWLGIDSVKDQDLLWIARAGLKDTLPNHWKPCKTPSDEVYYFNFETGESVWDHPCDTYWRGLLNEERERAEKIERLIRRTDRRKKKAKHGLASEQKVETQKSLDLSTSKAHQNCPTKLATKGIAVLEEDLSDNFEPTPRQVLQHAEWLGIDTKADRDLLWIASAALKDPLPKEWKLCRTPQNEIFYLNFTNGEIVTDHPCDGHWRRVYAQEKKKKDKREKRRRKRLQESMAASDNDTSTSSTSQDLNPDDEQRRFRSKLKKASTRHLAEQVLDAERRKWEAQLVDELAALKRNFLEERRRQLEEAAAEEASVQGQSLRRAIMEMERAVEEGLERVRTQLMDVLPKVPWNEGPAERELRAAGMEEALKQAQSMMQEELSAHDSTRCSPADAAEEDQEEEEEELVIDDDDEEEAIEEMDETEQDESGLLDFVQEEEGEQECGGVQVAGGGDEEEEEEEEEAGQRKSDEKSGELSPNSRSAREREEAEGSKEDSFCVRSGQEEEEGQEEEGQEEEGQEEEQDVEARVDEDEDGEESRQAEGETWEEEVPKAAAAAEEEEEEEQEEEEEEQEEEEQEGTAMAEGEEGQVGAAAEELSGEAAVGVAGGKQAAGLEEAINTAATEGEGEVDAVVEEVTAGAAARAEDNKCEEEGHDEEEVDEAKEDEEEQDEEEEDEDQVVEEEQEEAGGGGKEAGEEEGVATEKEEREEVVEAEEAGVVQAEREAAGRAWGEEDAERGKEGGESAGLEEADGVGCARAEAEGGEEESERREGQAEAVTEGGEDSVIRDGQEEFLPMEEEAKAEVDEGEEDVEVEAQNEEGRERREQEEEEEEEAEAGHVEGEPAEEEVAVVGGHQQNEGAAADLEVAWDKSGMGVGAEAAAGAERAEGERMRVATADGEEGFEEGGDERGGIVGDGEEEAGDDGVRTEEDGVGSAEGDGEEVAAPLDRAPSEGFLMVFQPFVDVEKAADRVPAHDGDEDVGFASQALQGAVRRAFARDRLHQVRAAAVLLQSAVLGRAIWHEMCARREGYAAGQLQARLRMALLQTKYANLLEKIASDLIRRTAAHTLQGQLRRVIVRMAQAERGVERAMGTLVGAVVERFREAELREAASQLQWYVLAKLERLLYLGLLEEQRRGGGMFWADDDENDSSSDCSSSSCSDPPDEEEPATQAEEEGGAAEDKKAEEDDVGARGEGGGSAHEGAVKEAESALTNCWTDANVSNYTGMGEGEQTTQIALPGSDSDRTWNGIVGQRPQAPARATPRRLPPWSGARDATARSLPASLVGSSGGSTPRSPSQHAGRPLAVSLPSSPLPPVCGRPYVPPFHLPDRLHPAATEPPRAKRRPSSSSSKSTGKARAVLNLKPLMDAAGLDQHWKRAAQWLPPAVAWEGGVRSPSASSSCSSQPDSSARRAARSSQPDSSTRRATHSAAMVSTPSARSRAHALPSLQQGATERKTAVMSTDEKGVAAGDLGGVGAGMREWGVSEGLGTNAHTEMPSSRRPPTPKFEGGPDAPTEAAEEDGGIEWVEHGSKHRRVRRRAQERGLEVHLRNAVVPYDLQRRRTLIRDSQELYLKARADLRRRHFLHSQDYLDSLSHVQQLQHTYEDHVASFAAAASS